MISNVVAERIGYGEPERVSVGEVTRRVSAGEAIVLRECLQVLGYMEEFRSLIRRAVEPVIGMERALKVEAGGIEYLHRYVNSAELVQITKQLQADLTVISMQMVKRVVREVLGVEGEACAEESRNVRIFVPHDDWMHGREEFLDFERERNRGKLTLHGPHSDLWGYHPLNVINLWVAIGPVLRDNGMSIWPEFFGEMPPMGEWHICRTDQVLGRPFGVELRAGDALLFHIGHIHGSRINQTGQTRFVCSARFTVGRPVLFDKPWYSYMSIDDIPEGIGVATPPCATEVVRPEVPPKTVDTSGRLPATVDAVQDGDGYVAVKVDELAVGAVRPLTDEYCVARTANGVVAFGRRCPHEGADLAAGYIQDGRVYCPGHNLGIDLETGASPCRSLRKIVVVKAEEADGLARVEV